MSHHQARGLLRRKHLINLIASAAAATCDTTTASYTEGSGSATLTIDSTVVSHGTKSLKLAVTGTGVWPYTYFAAPTAGAPVTVGQQYTAAVAAKIAAGSQTQGICHITWFTSGGSFVSGTDGSPITINGTTWTVLTVTGTAPATAAYAVPQFQTNAAWSSTDAVNLDDWAVYAGSVGTPWSSP